MSDTLQSSTTPETTAAEVVGKYLEALETGNAPDREALVARHPEHADALRAAFLGLEFVHLAANNLARDRGDSGAESRTDADGASPGKALGDYRIVREIGRGGMAVVYEAEQVSLGRRVALKVLPLAAILDPKRLQRFRNEAQAAAHLHHPHIVPVYAVGCERGVHYFAMQYIEGESLEIVIREMRERGRSEGKAESRSPLSSHGSNREPAYVRAAIAIGIQAAEALDHAHQMGIVHRDVKPGNLLVDAAGNLWISDFGLATSPEAGSLTTTGEIVGTIRYMSPEQALAKRAPVDHRTDVYSLGATLYELLTLEPAFPGDDVHQVMQDIALRDPTSPRARNPALPVDLETILLKAMEKDPAGRYATAKELADDLGRCLENRPIRARRPSLSGRMAKWSGRHRSLVAASVGLLVVAVVALAVVTARIAEEEGRTRTALQGSQANLGVARGAVAKFLVEAGLSDLSDEPLPSPRRRELLEAALAVYPTYLGRTDLHATRVRGNILHALHRYEEALAACDAILDVRPRDADALRGRGHMLMHLSRHVDGLVALRRAVALARDSASARLFLGLALQETDDIEGAIGEFLEAIKLEPKNSAAHFNLGIARAAKGDSPGAISGFREAIRIRPDYAKAHVNLGVQLSTTGQTDEAMQEFRKAMWHDPELVEAHVNLGRLLRVRGDFDGAVHEGREAVRLQPGSCAAHVNLGNSLYCYHEFDEAILEYREAIRICADDAKPNCGIGSALPESSKHDGAIPATRELVHLSDGDCARIGLGNALAVKGDFCGAIQEYRKAFESQPNRAEAHCEIGNTLVRCGGYREALPWLRKGHELGSARPGWRNPSGKWIANAERMVELEEHMDGILSGEVTLRDAAERVEVAKILRFKARYADSARAYAEAFSESPALAENKSSRYDAACSAALAAARGESDAAEWRGRALGWLRSELAAYEKRPSPPATMLDWWMRDPDFSTLRDRREDLPAREREDWDQLWADVARARERGTK